MAPNANAASDADRRDSRGLLHPSGCPDPHSSPIFKPSADDLTEIVKQQYMPSGDSEDPTKTDTFGIGKSRICGAWVGVLPNLLHATHNPQVLWKAMTVLANTVVSPNPRLSHVEASLHNYHAAVTMVRRNLAIIPCSIELIPAVMCLALVEVLLSFRPS